MIRINPTMWLSAGAPRTKITGIDDETGDITVERIHTIDPLAPIELNVPYPDSDQRARLYANIFAQLAYIEFMRKWRDQRSKQIYVGDYLEWILESIESVESLAEP